MINKLKESWFLAVYWLFLGLTFLLLINASFRGLDITDESFYFLCSLHPDLYHDVLFSFGYVSKVILKLCFDNFICYRIFCNLLTLFSGFVFSVSLLDFLNNRFSLSLKKREVYHFLILLSFSGLLIKSSLVNDVGYNILNLNFLILSCAFFLKILSGKENILNYFFFSFFFSLIFLTRLSTFFSSALVYLFIYLFDRKFKKTKSVIFSVLLVVGFVMAYILIIWGDFETYLYTLKESILRQKIMDSGHDIKGLIIGSLKTILVPISLFLLMVLVFFLNSRGITDRLKLNPKGFKPLPIFIFGSIFSLILLSICYYYQFSNRVIYYSFLLTFLVIFFSSFFFNIKSLSFIGFGYKDIFLFSCLFFALPHSFYLGSNNSYVYMVRFALFFIVAFSVVFLIVSRGTSLKIQNNSFQFILPSFALIFFTTILIANIRPYRLSRDIFHQNKKCYVGNNNFLWLDSLTYNYFNQLRKLSKKAIVNSDYLIDFTGASPGVNLILEKKFIGAPWLFGNYKGSNNYAYRVLSSEDINKIKRAYILTAPNGSRKLDTQGILKKMGINFPDDYKKIGDAYLELRKEKQVLWVPKKIL